MLLRRFFGVFVFALWVAMAVAQVPIRFARFPAPSPDGKQVAFSWQGDLWLAPMEGGPARRLTVHPAYEFGPLWSPDGTRIAFTADRFGNDDVFVLHLTTGEIQRLTWFSGRDRALGWLPDGSGVIFESRRDWEPFGAEFVPYVAPLRGGTPYRLHDVAGTPVALAPDGKQVAFVRRDGTWWRKGYRGSAQGDLWLTTLGTRNFVRLTNTDTPDTFPMWAPDGRTLYFVSERDGTFNLYAMDVPTKRVRQLTRFKEDGVRFPQINARGTVITFEQGMDLWRLELPSGTLRPINVSAPALDTRTPTEITRTFTANVTEYAIAPEAKEVAYVVRGEIFVTRFPDGGASTNLTHTTEPEEGLVWTKDGKHLIYVGERNGQTDLFRVTSDDPNEPRLRRATRHKHEPLTQTPVSETSPKLSPDGKWLAFQRGQGDLVVMNLETREERTLVSSWNLGNFVWSPDSRWIAYDQSDENYNSDIWVIARGGGEPVNLSRHPRNDIAPSWSADGRAMVFLSERDTDSYNIYHVYLRKADFERTRADREDEEDDKHDAPKKPDEKKDEPTVTIDFEDIHLRIRAVTRYAEGVQEAVISPDAEQIAYRTAYQGQADLYVIKWDGTEERRLTTGGQAPSSIQWSKDGKTLYFLSRGRLNRISASGGTAQATRTDARITINVPAENNYLLDAVWRTLNEAFYDPNFHGTNWSAMREKYRPYLAHAHTDRDLTIVMLMMLGELKSSHLSFSKGSGEPTGETRSETGMLGVVFSNQREGDGLLIERVIPNTPATRQEVNLQPGERIMAVNGKPVTPTTNIWQLLDNTVGERVELRVRQVDGAERTVFLRPISPTAYNAARYQAWVAERRQYVEQKSGGKLGYVHIQAMSDASLRVFERDLYAAAHGKQALIIDVRFNGGGRTADYLFGMLSVPRHAYTVGRNGKPGYPIDRLPLVPWHNPIAVLCNERSFSNAEIFAHGIKTLKRGPLIGLPTAGGVISTSQRTLMDGSSVGVPLRGWYTIDKHLNLEGNGAVPDHLVEDLPEDLMDGRDRQLDKAIEVLMRQIRD
ncbi:MAG: S41 family peptidase [Fimbriimonadales bacterium]